MALNEIGCRAYELARAGRSTRSLAFVLRQRAKAAMAPWIAVATVARIPRPVAYPNTGFGLAAKAVAGAMYRESGTRVFYVTTGGFDTPWGQNVNRAPTVLLHG